MFSRHGMLVMAYLGQALTDAVRRPAFARSRRALSRSRSLARNLTCEGHVTELLDHEGEKRARLALTTKDENGEVKLAGEAIIAL